MKLLEDKLANTVLSEVIEPDSLVLVDVNDQKELTIIVDRSEAPILDVKPSDAVVDKSPEPIAN
jgi:hypothetical protein